MRNEKGKIPLSTCQKEYAQTTAELQQLNDQYQDLKNEVDQANKFRVRVYDVLRKERQVGQPVKEQSMVL